MIKVLFLAANPNDTGVTLDLKTEFERVKESLCQSDQGSIFDVVREEHVNAAQLHRHLFTYKPRIVHFGGHGTPNGDPIFVDESDRSAPVSRQALFDLFGTINQNHQHVQCVVLNACWSDEVAIGLAEFVPCVVGMTSAIADTAAIAFATGFYQAIGYGWNVKSAVEFGKDQIRLVQPRGSNDWDMPKERMNDKYDPKKYVIRDEQLLTVRSLLHGKYHLKEARGIGLIARTDVALDLELERRVVIKTLIEPAGRAAFEREVHELALVSKHPNIVTIYGAWLREEPPHYVREYVEGWSLRSQLDRDGRADLPIDFVHQVLTSLGEAMLFAARAGVTDLGIEPEKVLIQKRQPDQGVGGVSRYHIVICPGTGGSDYIRSVLPSRLGEASRVYVPPEYFPHNRMMSVNDQQANQYRLGILGYEMLVGSTNFRREAAARKSESQVWRKVKQVDPDRRCPSFLSNAIERMIDPEPGRRFATFEEAVGAIAYRNLDVEVARESFYRLQKEAPPEGKRRFFFEFYRVFLEDSDIRAVFDDFPEHGEPPDPRWEKQYDMLKEAVIFLLVFSLLREDISTERTILSRIADTHCPSLVRSKDNRFSQMRVEHYDRFGRVLVETAVMFDQQGIDKYELRRAWESAIRPGLDYLKNHLRARLAAVEVVPPALPDGDRPESQGQMPSDKSSTPAKKGRSKQQGGGSKSSRSRKKEE